MGGRTWTYEELTAEVERQIVKSMAEVEKEISQSSKTMKRDWAFGAYFMWLSLVEGAATSEDRLRIKALIKPLE
jgi:hypothetical protein